jgi:uncharacterized ion transporter superfamily protein YfcC
LKRSLLERVNIPHVFVLLTGAILLCSALTYVLPSGEYERETIVVNHHERSVVKAGTYQAIPKKVSLRGVLIGDPEEGFASPVSVTGFLSAIPRGMERSAGIIFFIFIIGGVLGILQRAGVIAAFLHALLDRLGHRADLLTAALMIAVGIGGSTLGMGEEFIPLVPIFLLVAKELGYDRIYGMAIVYVGAAVGFAAATTNPFTVNIANGIAELPPNHGIPFRLVFFACCMTVTIAYVLRYGRKLRRDPAASLMADDEFDLSGSRCRGCRCPTLRRPLSGGWKRWSSRPWWWDSPGASRWCSPMAKSSTPWSTRRPRFCSSSRRRSRRRACWSSRARSTW